LLSLDVGCANTKRGTIGVDRRRGTDADVICDIHYLPFKDECFDSVFSGNVLEHSPNPLIFLKEQHRVLRPKGKVITRTDNAQYYTWAVMRPGHGGIRNEDYDPEHVAIFYPKNVERLFKHAGFRVTGWQPIYRNSKFDFIAKALVTLTVWRKETLFYHFDVWGIKE
jgi:ubiquinone/menaquinone biosynthesis C-methylase UbiE